MSEISEEATNLIDNFEYAVEDAVSDYTMACGASQKHQARRNLEDYIAELEAARRWIPVSEKPTKSDWYLIMYQGYGVPVAGYYHVDGGWLSDIPDCWMPLPEPPEVV